MQNQHDKNQPQKKEEEKEVKVETIIIEADKPFGADNMPTTREDIRRQLGFKR